MKNMIRGLRVVAASVLLGAFMASAVHAGDIRDGRAIVTPMKDDQYKIDSYTFGKAELFGYISDLKETKKITGIVLKNGHGDDKKATDEQRHSVASIGNTLQLETFTQDGKELTPLSME